MTVTNNPAMTEKKKYFTPLIIFILALATKFAIYYLAADHTLFLKYPVFAEKLANGFDIGERVLDLSPFYLYFSVVVYKLFGPNWELLPLFQIVLGSSNCIIVYFIGMRLFNAATGLIAAILLLFYGNLTLIELTLEPEIFVLLFTALAVIALLKAGADNRTDYRWWFLAGMLIGLAAITKANALLLLPGAAIWICLTVRYWRNMLTAVAIMLLGISLLVAPITLRNYLLFHDFVLITADGGKVFYHGNGPGATGMARADLPDQFLLEEGIGPDEPDYAHTLFRKMARELTKMPLKPSECADFWFARTLAHIKSQPGAALHLELKKFCLFWHNYEVHDLDPTYHNYDTLRQWPLVTMGIIAPLALLGMAIPLGGFRRAFLLYWLVFSYLASALLFFSASRYRLPAAPFLAIFAAHFLVNFYLLIRQKAMKTVTVRGLLLLLLLVGAYVPFHQEIDKYDLWQQAMRIHYVRGEELFTRRQYPESIREFEAALSGAPELARSYLYQGKAYAILGDHEKAVNCFKKFIDLAPNFDDGYAAMGFLLVLKGDQTKALPYFEKALALNPHNAKVKEQWEKITRPSL